MLTIEIIVFSGGYVQGLNKQFSIKHKQLHSQHLGGIVSKSHHFCYLDDDE